MRYAIFGLTLLVTACDPHTPRTSPTPIDANDVAATLEITIFALGAPTLHDGWFVYEPQLQLHETTGLGHALIKNVTYTMPDNNSFILGFDDRLSSVAPGSYWQITADQYYLQTVDSRAPLDSLKVTVTYADPAGTVKKVSAQIRSSAAATLEVTSFTLGTPDFNNGWYFYYPQLELKETTGLGTASITQVMYTLPNGDRNGISGGGCYLPSTVAPSATWNINAISYYCQDVDSQVQIDSLKVTVSYTDTAGNTKAVSATSR